MSKGGFQWPPAFRVAPNMETFQNERLRKFTPCHPAPLPVVARHMAEVHAELLLIHPFRDGNGRLARWLADLMALQAGLSPPHYAFRGRGARERRVSYLAAVKRAYLEDYGALTDFFVEAVERRLRGAADD
jgi:cell filamentation protein